MYVAPESKVMMAMANVVSTSGETQPVVTDDPNALPPIEFEE